MLLIDKVYSEMKYFFSQSLEIKMKVLADENFRGYTPMKKETLDPKHQTCGIKINLYIRF